MRALYVWDDEYPWDVRTQKVCAALTGAEHDVHLAARNRRRAPLVEQLPEATVHRLRPWPAAGARADALLQFPAFFNPRWLAHLGRLARELRPDVLLVRDLPLCPTTLRVGRKYGIPVVLDMAEDYAALIRSTWNAGRQKPWDVLVRNPAMIAAVERWCVPRLDHVLVVVEESGERLVRELGLPADRVTVVSNTPPLARLDSFSGSDAAVERRPTGRTADLELVYLGLFEVPRGIGELIEAMGVLRDETPSLSVRLTLVGDGRDAALFRARAEQLKLGPDRVVFRGYLPYDEALKLVAEADVGVVPHHAIAHWNSTIPNKLFDYMAAGLAVITSDAKPAARIVRTSGAGEVFRAGDARDLARAIVRLADPARRAQASAAGVRAIGEHYHWERDVAALLRVVQAVSRRANTRSTTSSDPSSSTVTAAHLE